MTLDLFLVGVVPGMLIGWFGQAWYRERRQRKEMEMWRDRFKQLNAMHQGLVQLLAAKEAELADARKLLASHGGPYK